LLTYKQTDRCRIKYNLLDGSKRNYQKRIPSLPRPKIVIRVQELTALAAFTIVFARVIVLLVSFPILTYCTYKKNKISAVETIVQAYNVDNCLISLSRNSELKELGKRDWRFSFWKQCSWLYRQN